MSDSNGLAFLCSSGTLGPEKLQQVVQRLVLASEAVVFNDYRCDATKAVLSLRQILQLCTFDVELQEINVAHRIDGAARRCQSWQRSVFQGFGDVRAS